PVLGEPELAAHLELEVLDVVAHAARPVAAQVAEVLADLRRVEPGQLGQALGGDGRQSVTGSFEQAAEVDGQARHRGLGDLPPPRLALRAVGHAIGCYFRLFTCSQARRRDLWHRHLTTDCALSATP